MDSVINVQEGGGMREQGRSEDCDFAVVVISWMEVRMVRQCIGFVLFAREMDEGEVIVSEVRNVARNSSVYVLGVTRVFKIFVVSVDRHGVGGPHEEVTPVSKAADQCK